jgi:hypothetical protein
MWLKLTDAFDESPRIVHTARTDADVDRIVGIVVRLMLYCSRQRTDGFVPALVVRQRLRSARLRRAFTCPDDGSAPLLHPRGTDCPCMRGMAWPATAGDYYVHGYLDNNPLAAEYDIAAQQRAELRDPELRLAVTRRDRERCRYCGVATRSHDRRSRTGRVLDHVDPGQAAGAANLVVACRECNSRKGRRTLAAAGLTLLPVPGDQGDDLSPTYDQTCDDDPDPTNREDTDVPGRDGTGRVHAPRPRTAGWAGPNGERHQTGPAPPRNSSTHPNPYLRVAITGPDPDDHAGLPDDDDLYGDDLPP